MNTLILKGRIVTSTDPPVIEKGILVIKNNIITYVGPEVDYTLTQDMTVYSIENGTILPGFIDCHAHLTGQENSGDSKLFGDQLLGAAHQLSTIIDSGFTSLRDMSEAGLYLSRAVSRGILKGPQILPGGKILGITSGHVDLEPHIPKDIYNKYNHLTRLVDGKEDCILGVREQFRLGAKFIKVCATGGVSSPTDQIDDVQFSFEELVSIVKETKRHNGYVAAHCTGKDGTYQALRAGVTCIEHGVELSEREIELMSKYDVTLVTTLAVSLGVAKIDSLPTWMADKAKLCAELNLKSIELARNSGIRIALGTDFSNSKHSSYKNLGSEFVAMTEAGLTPLEAIKSGTINAAHLMMNESIGELKSGKTADVVLVSGNPLKNISCLKDSDNIKLVIKNGEVLKNII
jgi:imidazolonepropionase-like amidohydrolase